MTLLRCSAQLLRYIAPAVGPEPSGPPPGRLGDWYARIVATRRQKLVLCTNERSFLSVVVPLTPQERLLDRFVMAARHRIDQIDAPVAVRTRERDALADIHIGRCTNRSVIGTMNQFGYAIGDWRDDHASPDLEALGQWLCDTPCSALRTAWPWLEAQILLTDRSGTSGVKGTRGRGYT